MAVLTHWDGEPVRVWARIWKADVVEAHDVLGSTNDRLRELADDGAGPFSVVVADEQSRGRGRSGAVWHSPPGAGLWLSTLLPRAAAVPVHLPLLLGVAAARAAEGVCDGTRVGIKWPNDLDVDGRKVGGILCELVHGHVLAGIGINVRLPTTGVPDDVAARATSLEGLTGGRVSVGALATVLMRELHALAARPGAVLATELHRELEERDALRDRLVVTQQAGQGTARGIAPDGALWLERPEGDRVRVISGSVRIS